MKLYLIAGEASGDLHGSNLIKALHHQYPGVECRAWGGDLMQQAGATVVKHYRDLAFMGFVEVAKNIKTILRNIDFCKKDILQFKPDAIVLIDYPGFNLRIAKWAHQQGIKVIYYISPQIWAWHQSRVHQIRRDVDLMLVILPFERAFYQKFDMEAVFVGHPLLDAVLQMQSQMDSDNNLGLPDKFIALLPGSRKQEVQRILPRMLEVVPDFPDYQFVIAAASSLPDAIYEPFMAGSTAVRIVRNNTYPILRKATAALVKSGTSTLEAALFNVPQVVCYTGNALSYQIAKRLVKVKYISLVNLVADRPLVCELIQQDLNRENLRKELAKILHPESVKTLREGYNELRMQLGAGGASERAAREIITFTRSNPPINS